MGQFTHQLLVVGDRFLSAAVAKTLLDRKPPNPEVDLLQRLSGEFPKFEAL